MTPDLKRTPLYQEHVNLRAKLVEFGGWEMPVQYTSLMDEHLTVRRDVGVFDISHMGQFHLVGDGAGKWLDSILTNNVSKLDIGQCHYTFLLNDKGGVIDDLIVYRRGEDRFFLVVNASRLEEDFSWMQNTLPQGLLFVNRSSDAGGIAVQGPNAQKIFKQLFPTAEYPARNRVIDFGDQILTTTGYTGEDGFELFTPASDIAEAWRKVLAAGAKPCGLGARDTLRLEMCYPLNGSDLSRDRTPLEAGLGFFVDLSKGEFTGKAALVRQKEQGMDCRLCALRVVTKSPPVRSHYPVYHGTELVSELTSGTFSPSLDTAIGMAYLPIALSTPGTEVEIDVRSRRYKAIVERKPLYKKKADEQIVPVVG